MSVLLRQPHGFEGLFSLGVRVDMKDLAGFDPGCDEQRHSPFDTASLSAPLCPGNQKDSCTGIEEPFGNDLKPFVSIVDLLEVRVAVYGHGDIGALEEIDRAFNPNVRPLRAVNSDATKTQRGA